MAETLQQGNKVKVPASENNTPGAWSKIMGTGTSRAGGIAKVEKALRDAEGESAGNSGSSVTRADGSRREYSTDPDTGIGFFTK